MINHVCKKRLSHCTNSDTVVFFTGSQVLHPESVQTSQSSVWQPHTGVRLPAPPHEALKHLPLSEHPKVWSGGNSRTKTINNHNNIIKFEIKTFFTGFIDPKKTCSKLDANACSSSWGGLLHHSCRELRCALWGEWGEWWEWCTVTLETAHCRTPSPAEIKSSGLRRKGLEISADCSCSFPSEKEKRKKTEQLQRRALSAPKLSACLTETAAWWLLIKALTKWGFLQCSFLYF